MMVMVLAVAGSSELDSLLRHYRLPSNDYAV